MAKRYWPDDTDVAIGNTSATYEKSMLPNEQTGAGTARSVTLTALEARQTHAFVTQTDDPGIADWPSGTYRCSLDVSTADSSIQYELGASGSETGGFRKLDSTASFGSGNAEQSEAVFTGTGVKLATASWNPVAGSVTDRFAVVIVATNGNSMMSQSFAIDVASADTWVEAPFKPKLDQYTFRGYEDSAPIGAGTPKAAEGVGWDQAPDVNFRVRLGVREWSGATKTTSLARLQCRKNGGTWQNVTDTSSIVRYSPSSHFADGAAVLESLTFGDLGDYSLGTAKESSSTGAFNIDTNPEGTTDNLLGAFGLLTRSEFEFCLQIVSGDVVDGDTIDFRLHDGAAESDYIDASSLATLTVDEAPAGTVYDDSPSGDVAESGSATESHSRSAAPTGDIVETGARVESHSRSVAPSGAIVASGSISESWSQAVEYDDTPTGAVVADGVLSDALARSSTPTGAVVAAGSIDEAFFVGYSDTPTGAVDATGALAEAHSRSGAASGDVAESGALAESHTRGYEPAGTAVATGALAEALAASDAPTGAVVASGSISESWSQSDAFDDQPTGAIVATGSLTEAHSRTAEISGDVDETGALARAAEYEDAPTGAVVSTGSISESWAQGYVDTPTGAIAAAGTLGESWAHTSTLPGVVIATGEIVESWNRAEEYDDHPAGTVVATGALAESLSRSTAPDGFVIATGAIVEGYGYVDAVSGVSTLSGALVEFVRFDDGPTGAVLARGTIIEDGPSPRRRRRRTPRFKLDPPTFNYYPFPPRR